MINRIIYFIRHCSFNTCGSRQKGLTGRVTGLHFSLFLLGSALLIANVSNSKAQYFNALPSCSEATVHARIVKRFNLADRTQWHRGTRLKYIRQASERAYNIYPDSQINRRYCRGKAYMSDGRSRRVHFLIEQHMGLASFGWDVEYCLKGSDYWHAYGGWCRVLRKY
jgi:hypothetical protein